MSVRYPAAGEREYSFDVEHAIGRILFVGGVVSVTLVVLGLAMYAVTTELRGAIQFAPWPGADGRSLPPHVFVSLSQILSSLSGLSSDPLALVALGLVALLSTPVLAVAVAAAVFVHQRDRQYSFIATIVLALLLVGFFFARGGG